MVAEFLWQLTGSRRLRNAVRRGENAVSEACGTLLMWQERSRQRRALGDLTDQLLLDIGRSREEAAHECAKPAWRS